MAGASVLETFPAAFPGSLAGSWVRRDLNWCLHGMLASQVCCIAGPGTPHLSLDAFLLAWPKRSPRCSGGEPSCSHRLESTRRSSASHVASFTDLPTPFHLGIQCPVAFMCLSSLVQVPSLQKHGHMPGKFFHQPSQQPLSAIPAGQVCLDQSLAFSGSSKEEGSHLVFVCKGLTNTNLI